MAFVYRSLEQGGNVFQFEGVQIGLTVAVALDSWTAVTDLLLTDDSILYL